MLQNIFNALASGATSQQGGSQAQAGGDVLSSVLGSLMGGGATQAAPAQNQTQNVGNELEGLLGSLMGGGTTQTAPVQNQTQNMGNELGGLLGSLMGSGTTQTAPVQSQTGTTNPLMNLIGSGQNPMVNALVQPIVDKIAGKLGISPQLAMLAVTFGIHYMLTNHGTKLANGQDMSGVLAQHSTTDHLHTAGISKDFAQQAGVTPTVAANTLSEVFKLLGAAGVGK